MAGDWILTNACRLCAVSPAPRRVRRALRAALPAVLILASALAYAGQTASPTPPAAPSASVKPPASRPPAPAPEEHPAAKPCFAKPSSALAAGAALGKTALLAGAGLQPHPCAPRLPIIDWYSRFLNGPQVKPLTALEKAHLAARNLIDPFNLLTIFGEAAISVADNSHSPYGPGFPGYGRYSGVSFTQDMTGEFFGTFLIPSIFHQDPHYHRMPDASIPRRFLHTIAQVVWTEGDNGKSMVNYADLLGFAFDEESNDLYVPGLQTDVPATAARYATDIATAPIDNLITEFLPDIARHIHVHVVLVQRIIDQVATTNGDSGTP